MSWKTRLPLDLLRRRAGAGRSRPARQGDSPSRHRRSEHLSGAARPRRALQAEQARFDAWTPFHERMHSQVIPSTAELLKRFRTKGLECLFARIATHTLDGRERSLCQKMPGWNNLLLPMHEKPSQLVAELAPAGDEIVVTKTTDSALTGTNLAPHPAQSRHQERHLRRHFHRPVHILDRAQPRR